MNVSSVVYSFFIGVSFRCATLCLVGVGFFLDGNGFLL